MSTIFSCTHLPDAIGKENEIVVITSPEDKDYVAHQLRDLFAHTIYTPQSESEFSIIYKNPWELEKVSTYGNLIITSLDYPEDSTGDLLMQRILSKNKQNKPLFVLGELYAKDQIVCVIHTLDAISMENEIELNKEWITNKFSDNLADRLELNIFKHGKNDLLSEKILDIFGYTIYLQQDYTIVKSDSLKQFIWLGRGYPYRWITLHKSNNNMFKNSVNAWEEISNIYTQSMPNIQIEDYFRSIEIFQYKNKKRQIMRGIYYHNESESGGPFFVYIFKTKTMNEVILVSGFINNPGYEKILLLKQLEIIAYTIH